LIDVKAPTGKFYIDPNESKPAVLIAGGVGITPLFCMLSAVVSSGREREVWLFYGVRNGRDHALKEALRELDHKHPHVHVVTCYSDPEKKDALGRDFDHAGRITTELLQAYLETNNYEFFVCGPPPMMDAITKSLAEWGVPKADIRTEAFGPASVPKKKSPPKDAAAKPAVFKIEFSKSKKTVDWDGKFDCLLDLGDFVGADLEGGCRAGNCGTCEVAVLSGEIEYNRDPEFPDIKDGCCLACIGVPKGNLVLDA
jgi:ferredoxin-NADP reductase